MSDLPTPPSTYILRELHDVAVPSSVSWYPQTIGWKILAAVRSLHWYISHIAWLGNGGIIVTEKKLYWRFRKSTRATKTCQKYCSLCLK